MSVVIGAKTNDSLTHDNQGYSDMNQRTKRFDKSICIKNIRYLMDKKNLKIGELEKASGNSIGYLSRLEKQDKTTDPSAEFLVTAAQILGITLDELIYDRLEDLSPNEESLLSFLKRLTDNTKKDAVNWDKETAEQHSMYENNHNLMDYPHILYTVDEEVIDTYPEPVGWKYDSKFFDDGRVKVKGTSYHARINEFDDYIYIMACSFRDSNEHDSDFYEIYHIDSERDILPVCSTYNAEERIVQAVERLINQIKESQGRIRLSMKTKMLFDTYK